MADGNESQMGLPPSDGSPQWHYSRGFHRLVTPTHTLLVNGGHWSICRDGNLLAEGNTRNVTLSKAAAIARCQTLPHPRHPKTVALLRTLLAEALAQGSPTPEEHTRVAELEAALAEFGRP